MSTDELSIDGIKTGLMGYHKEAVLEYIRLLRKQMETIREEERSHMSETIMDLENNNNKLQSQIEIYKENYEMLNRHLDEITRVWDQNVQYVAQRDALLLEYQQKEASMKERLEKAEEEARSILDGIAENRLRMMEQVNEECEKMMGQGKEQVAMCKLELAKMQI